MEHDEIDDSFYSRQRYVLGDSGMLKLNRSNVLIVGLGGVGLEIAKNVILSGVQLVTIKDNQKPATYDLGTNFYLKSDDISSGKSRSELCLSKLKELNSHVKVELDTENEINFNKLSKFQCVVLTECSLDLIKKVDSFCYRHDPPIKVIVADVYGVFGGVFCDFGPSFEIVDKTGEDPIELFCADITKEKVGIVTLHEDQRIGSLTDGLTVTFREVQGMWQLNGTSHRIKVRTPLSFEIGDTSTFDDYVGGGICSEIVVPSVESHVNFDKHTDCFDYLTFNDSKPELDATAHVAFLALHAIVNGKILESAEFPQEHFLKVCQSVFERFNIKKDLKLDLNYLKIIWHTFRGQLTPLFSFVGGFAAQEVLKALTCKFTPLNQWVNFFIFNQACKKCDGFFVFYMYINVPEVFIGAGQSMKNDRYDSLRMCIGDDGCKKLNELKIFLVGCGAIGCELLKIFALMGIACESSGGEIYVTDNDIIEKSNLNRQFLFKDRHIRMSKSDVGASSVREINRAINIKSSQNVVSPTTEEIFNEEFFASRDIIVNALDNIEARIYVDERCVSAEKPLLDSGTMGTKGSVQVILPHLTENYGRSRDPEDHSVLLCTLKSFPATVNHTIIWARNKFESLFVEKPNKFNSFWNENGSPVYVFEKIKSSNSLPTNAVAVLKLLINWPTSLIDCVRLARLKFEKYFNHKAKQLINVFPLDHRLNDGSLFWQLPKRAPKPLNFDSDHFDDACMNFVISMAKLFSVLYQIPGESKINSDFVVDALRDVDVPEFVPKNKKIAIDDDELTNQTTAVDDSDDVQWSLNTLKKLIDDNRSPTVTRLNSISFEKDDDLHIDFVTAASNLRAIMYGLQPADRFTTKKIAGKIIPAISTTTACVSGLVALELIKIALKIDDLSRYRNYYLNLAFPVILFTQPLEAEKVKIGENEFITVWNKCKIYGWDDFTLSDLIKNLEEKYNGVVTMVAEGKKAFYLPPMICNKTQMKMKDLSEFYNSGRKFVDLVVTMDSKNGDDSLECPTIRYYF